MLRGLFAAPQPPQNTPSCLIVQGNYVVSSPCLQIQFVTSLWKPTGLFRALVHSGRYLLIAFLSSMEIYFFINISHVMRTVLTPNNKDPN